MTFALGLSVLVATLGGTLLVRRVWSRADVAFSWPLTISLGIGLGAGISSVLLFTWLLAAGPSRGFVLAEVGLLVVGLWIGGKAARAGSSTSWPAQPPPAGALSLLLGAAFLLALVGAAAGFVGTLRQHPHGEWDAWMNWDLRARMIFRGGEHWKAAFSTTFPWSHPDYPVLVPSLVVRSWLYTGRETLLGPAVVAATFTFGTVALLVTALAALRSPAQGLLAGLVLVSTPFFIDHGTSLYADVPLGFFFLATLVCLALDARSGTPDRRFAVLAGLAAGMGMWTKNEGLLFALALTAGLLVTGSRERSGRTRRLLAFGAGLLPLLLLVFSFKATFAPANDLLSTLGLERTLGRLGAPERYTLVIREYAEHVVRFGTNAFSSAAIPLAGCLLGLGVRRRTGGRSWARAGFAALLLLLAGHYLVFVTMADELARLLASSLDRLLLQIYPSVLFLCFAVFRTPEEVYAEGASVAPARERAPLLRAYR
jgi:dolichyl-phosphate-mannose-protein mannosyltransferase